MRDDQGIHFNQSREFFPRMVLESREFRGLHFCCPPTSLARDPDLATAPKPTPLGLELHLHDPSRRRHHPGPQLGLDASSNALNLMNTQRVTIGESTFNVAVEGSGQPILFVHGFPLDHSMWRFQFDEFSKRNQVICPDLPGFGQSPRGGVPLSMQSIADDLSKLLDALAIDEPVVFCGLSMGGYVGWQFWKHHRQRLSHLVACNTRAANDAPEVARARRIAAQSVRQTGSQTVADTMIEKLFYQFDDPANKQIVDSVYEVIMNTDAESIANGQLAMAARSDATHGLAAIDVPTLFVVGEHDVITPPEEMRQNSDLAPCSKLMTIKKAGHMSPLEQPIEFNRGLREFLDERY